MLSIVVIGVCTGLATVLGAVLAQLAPVRDRWLASLLGAAAGIMVGLSLFGLLPEGNKICGPKIVGAGFLWGLALMRFIEELLHGRTRRRTDAAYTGMGVLIAVGIAFHNFPEGIALGAGFRGGDNLGYLIAFSLALHNIPEGISIAAPLKRGGVSLGRILGLAALAGLVTPIGAALGWLMSGLSPAFLGMSMGIAAGAMVYISFDALIPTALLLDRRYSNGGIYTGILLAFLLQCL